MEHRIKPKDKNAGGIQRLIRKNGSTPFFAPAVIQPKLKVNAPNDIYEKEADAVADKVMRMPDTAGSVQRKCKHCEDEEKIQRKPLIDGISPLIQRKAEGVDNSASPGLTSSLQSSKGSGNPLPRETCSWMETRFGTDFSGVNIHTDEKAVQLSQDINAQAFTHGSDIYFNKGKFAPDSAAGKRLLAHELTHVVQQSQMTDGTAQREIIQRTTVGNVLDNFFSPFSSETLWIMDENDNYTRIVRRWQPVIDAVNQAKTNLEANCATWNTTHMTDSSWTPGMTDPPVTDPNARDSWISSPPGTDPETCKAAFIIYAASHGINFFAPVQSFELYTCSIGSFGIYVTVDSIDCAAQTARMNVWMYNAMDQESFGAFADHPAFALSGMERQYMWWNWSESHNWGSSGGSVSPGSDSGNWWDW